MEFLKRPVAPYFVPVPELDGLPSGETEPIPVAQPELIESHAPATERSRIREATQPPSPRIAAVLGLESPTLDDLAAFLADDDPGVRRTAVNTLTEHLPDGYSAALVPALGDPDATVRREAASGLRELVEVIPNPTATAAFLGSTDPVVRAIAVYVLSFRGAGDPQQYRAALTDDDHHVRIEAVRALVSVDDVAGVEQAGSDANREVRIAAANGLATLGGGGVVVRALLADRDPLVRAAALAALASVGYTDSDATAMQRALTDNAWQIRQGAARGLAGAPADIAVPVLSGAISDPHLDVRKAAVLSLTRWAATESASRDVLRTALDDGDADVRAYARHALSRAHTAHV